VSVTPDGSRLVVSERLSNRLETLALDEAGRPGAPVISASSGTVPFGFAFGRRGELIVSEAGASSVSSYRIGSGGALTTISPHCWSSRAPPAGSRPRRTAGSPIPATPPAASAGSRSALAVP
jgi:6-phosphogluconolactonase (cycloisomerase 2 family)